MKIQQFLHANSARQKSGSDPKSELWKKLLSEIGSSTLTKMLGAAIASTILVSGGKVLAQVYSYGSSGPDVADIQQALGIPADGEYGAQTEDAVREFQARNGLAVDGVAGYDTLTALGLTYLTGGNSNVGGPSDPVPGYSSFPSGARTATVRTGGGTGINVRNRPDGDPVAGIDDGTRINLTGRQQPAGGYNWAELEGGGWVATEYLVAGSVGGPSVPSYPSYPGYPSYPSYPGNSYSGGPYVVAVPGSDPALLYGVRRVSPGAYQDSSGRGSFVNAGSFQSRAAAEAMNRRVRDAGFDSRIIYD